MQIIFEWKLGIFIHGMARRDVETSDATLHASLLI